ncbi:aminotransferase class I/II-fold pyridoxal phosphate-dependent enzyme [Gluconobacter sp. LMG 1744]|uniref:aminotransferase-like domain-containing protein n=1 Tax=Gluconobacter cadivus TaxID=2728101 RepID=UPI001884AAD9|nr:aminotransferase class I/II-fold pyridoxal phosphate-dependent enzyme [Gluconobacter cadivus]MBF0892533.1 aminotransferase class I/II-fold pyridoxal phosphate-dependent enzyme [Gluconobacter cadivus]
MEEFNPEWFVNRLHDRSARGLARQISALIQSGTLPVGTRLPSIRDLAFGLGISPATVSIAWTDLRKRGIIAGRGRRGMHVCNMFLSPRPVRRTASLSSENVSLNLTSYTPDPGRLPHLSDAFEALTSIPNLNTYNDETISPALRAICAAHWPYPAEDFMATNGAYSALFDTMQALIPPGSTVAVQDPAPMRILDILDYLSTSILPLQSDTDGILPASLAQALARNPTALYLQPNINAITGQRMSRARLHELAQILRTSPSTWIIEDDAFPWFSDVLAESIGVWLGPRVIHVRSLSKILGPDLRLGIVSASSMIIREIQAYRSFGPVWTSRLLQTVAARLLENEKTHQTIHGNYRHHQEQRHEMTSALRHNGIDIPTGEGFSFWIPVLNDEAACASLASQNIRVSAGHQCSLLAPSHIRFSISHLSGDFERIAAALQQAARKTASPGEQSDPKPVW